MSGIEMLQCDRGHFYSSSERQCPYCASSTQGTAGPTRGGPNRGPGAVPPPPGAQDGYTRQRDDARPQDQPGSASEGSTKRPWRPHAKPSDPNQPEGAGSSRPTEESSFDANALTVGWLVCTKGARKGQDYRLRPHVNRIGRDPGNDVQISGDSEVSRQGHAKIAFDPRHATFTLIPGDGQNIVYVNDTATYTPLELNAFDRIEVGQTTLILVPLCGKEFQWD